jgi:hypothetical protein
MIGVDLVPLISTGIGAAIALGGTVLADLMRSRDTRERDRITDRRDVYLQLTLAHGLALQELRDVAGRSFGSEADRLAAVAAAMTVSGIYPARDRLLMAAPRWVLRSAEIAFDRLIRLRDVVRTGVAVRSIDYHEAYHPYGEAMWALRNAIRTDLGASRMTPADLARESWENRETCQVCQARVSAPASEPAGAAFEPGSARARPPADSAGAARPPADSASAASGKP